VDSTKEVPIKEIRVHGVSGTPPREMLYTDPIPRLDGDKYARIFRKRPSLDANHTSGRPYNTEAFHWGSLTTGHWLTSLWILLAPFAFANVAGWMALRRSAWHRSTIRLAGLALTSLLVAQMGYVVVAVPILYATNNSWSESSLAILRSGTALGYVLLFGALVLRLSTQSHFDPLSYAKRFRLLFSPTLAAMKPPNQPDSGGWSDPAAAKVTEPVMWQVHSIVHRLRRVHYATGQFVVVLILAGVVDSNAMRWVAVSGLAATALLLVLTSAAPENRLVLFSTAWITIAAEGVALAAVAMLTLHTGTLDLDAIHRTTFHVAIALGAASAVAIVGGVPGIGALTIATFLGGAFGVGAGLVAEDALSIGENLVAQGGAWVLPASLIFVLFVALVAVLLTYFGPPDLSGESFLSRITTRITRRSRFLLMSAAGFGLIAGAAAVVQGCITTDGMCQPDSLTSFPGSDAAVFGLLTAVLVLLGIRLGAKKPVAAALLAIGAATVAWIGLTDPTIGAFAPRSYLEALPLSRTLIFIAPIFAIGRSVLGAYRQGASSRKVGVVWDVASFWPRWFHPLAPPAYGPKVITELQKHLGTGDVDVLAAHSQGSVIAAIATQQALMAGSGVPSGVITYGSPIRLLYTKLFPDTGIDELVNDLPPRLRRGWVNLWRVDDPIGGEPLGGSVESVLDSLGTGHSGYELGKPYRATRDRQAD
jgi:hypothetical protein